MASHAVAYFGESTVERAIAYYFAKHGLTVKARDQLIDMEVKDGDAFFEMVADFIENVESF